MIRKNNSILVGKYVNTLHFELKKYIKTYLINVTIIPEKYQLLKNIFIKDDTENITKFAVACKQMEDGNNIFNAFVSRFSKLPSTFNQKIYLDTMNIKNVDLCNELVNEIDQVIKYNRFVEIGLMCDIKKNHKIYSLNADIFATYMLKRVKLYTLENGQFLIYSNEGYYEVVNDIIIKKIILFLLEEVKKHVWKSIWENEIIKVLKLKVQIVKEINNDKKFLNLENGILNLNTLEIIPHSPDIFSTIRIPIIYDEFSKCTKFMKFVDEIMCGDTELIMVIQELMGYCLTAETKAEKAFIFYGTGSNGKSVLAKIIQMLVGRENVSSATLDKLSQPFGLESIIGKTVNIGCENELSNNKINTENLKSIISADLIEIAIKYKSSLIYRPICKLIFLMNSLPNTSDNTYGFYRKIVIIPFRKKFIDADKDVDLFNKLKTEMPGILNWSLDGLKRLRNNNFQFTRSKSIEESLKTYEQSQNPVIGYVRDCITEKHGNCVSKKNILNAYYRWLEENGIDDMGSKSCQKFWKLFKIAMDKCGYTYSEKKIRGYMFVDNIYFKQTENSDNVN